MRHDTEHQIKEPEREPEQSAPDPSSYGMLVDRMVETVASWPREYQRSVDVHHLGYSHSSSNP